jgi:DNA primase large subunit
MGKNKKMEKIAYEIGTQGYAIMNDRAFCNCQKKKMQTTASHQDAWFDCWEEYKEAYNSDPDKWLAEYVPLEDYVKIKESSSIKKMMKESFVKDVEERIGESKLVGASIRNQIRHYIHEELKEKIKNS